MRFSAAIQPQQPLRMPAAAELIRRLVSGEMAQRPQPAPVRVEDLPADLDQRVRLVGEW
ncbi:MAG: hypothetical protein JWQ07_1736 [Ramlibacter sp.]|nr:hypothetical protein [Ramlibacter sp.]